MKFYHGDIILDVPETVYYPREDSLLLAKILEKENLAAKKVLEIGCGSGFLAILMTKKGAIVSAIDISDEAVKVTNQNAKTNGTALTCFQSNLFSAVTSKFDLIIFNPPYLPDESNDATYSGGKTGRKVIEKFIENTKDFLERDGKILLLISSLTGENEVIPLFHTYSFKTKVIAREKIPWEELMVIEAK